MFTSPYFSSVFQKSSNDIGTVILRDLQSIVVKVRRARKWYLVDKLTRAFIESCLLMKLKTIKSRILMKAVIKTIKKLRELASEEAKLIDRGLSEAWRISELASIWGHPFSKNWRNNKYFIIYQAITLEWIKKLFRGVLPT